MHHGFFITNNKKQNIELVSVKSEKELEKIYEGEIDDPEENIFFNIMTMPMRIIYELGDYLDYNRSITAIDDDYDIEDSLSFDPSDVTSSEGTSNVFENITDSIIDARDTQTTKDYSTTNIQVENVDEADITKTDGDYIYSISEDNVVITDVRNPEDIKIASKIAISDGVPEDLILYNDKLVVISTDTDNDRNYTYYNYSSYSGDTNVKIYDVQNRERPKMLKNYTLYEPYYTSRCVNNKLYVIASGTLREENGKIVTTYTEGYKDKEIGLENIKYLKNHETDDQTLISTVDLDNVKQDVNVKSYLIDINNAYVSEHNIYLLDANYEYVWDSSVPPISSIFGLKGIFGAIDYDEEEDDDSGYKTKIYKFNILENGEIKYDKRAEIDGETINQFSIDEYNGNLRVALHSDEGSRVVIFNEKLDKIGESPNLAKGEEMYSSRFLGDKAYLVTYRTVDPLYVIDLSNPKDPTVLGELKIPGYSTYLHPYDENHLIGIGMETKENVNRDASGRVRSTTATIVGMKMALFDVSDVENPIQISSTVIGDSRATSAILTNHKALLFSKEKELIAIPVNNYKEDFEVKNTSDTYSSIIDSYKSYSKPYVSEGYFVYKLNLDEGFKLKGIVNHEKTTNKYRYPYYNTSKLLRGLYIDNNLYTISEEAIKVNNLEDLKLVDEINIKKEEK